MAVTAERTWDFGRLAAVDEVGPWTGEPDKVLWVDPTSNLDCMMLRNHQGGWCGYVGVPSQHPWFEVGFDDIHPYPEVHGGVNYSAACQEGEGDDAICHTPMAGRSGHLWWLGFDCGHAWDFQPLAHLRLKQICRDDLPDRIREGTTYRTLEYVRDQVTLLALQAYVAGR